MTPAIYTNAAAMLRELAHDLAEAHTRPDGEWDIQCPGDEKAQRDHGHALALARDLDTAASLEPWPPTRLDPDHARVRNMLAHLAGAARGLLHQIHEAGGYHVFDPARQPVIQECMSALEQATIDALSLPGPATMYD